MKTKKRQVTGQGTAQNVADNEAMCTVISTTKVPNILELRYFIEDRYVRFFNRIITIPCLNYDT